MFTAKFWKRTAERAVKTGAEVFIGLIGANTFDVLHTDWIGMLSLTAGGMILSVLASLASSTIGNSDDPSLV